MKILILFGHPAFQSSHVNKYLVKGLDQFPGVTFRDLYEHYPEMDIDIDEEQRLLKEHDCIVFHHPMYWYSTPAIFKEWQDLVLEHGWAYGSQGNELKGKWFFNATTTGASRPAFKKGEFQNHTVHEFFVPMKQMALLCGMIPLPPFVVHGTHLVTKEGVLSAQQSYHRLLELLVHDRLALGEILKVNYLNDLLGKEVKNA